MNEYKRLNIHNANALVFDTETHSLKNPQMIESGLLPIQFRKNKINLYDLTIGIAQIKRYNPGIAIDAGAMAVHHILDEDLVDKPSPACFEIPDQIEFLIGHNIQFDLEVAKINKAQYCIIDTLSLARALWPELSTGYKQTALFYHFTRLNNEDMYKARALAQDAHAALADITICAQLCRFIANEVKKRLLLYANSANESALDAKKLLEHDILPLLSYLSDLTTPAIIYELTFGKHKGSIPWEIPSDYIHWYSKQEDHKPNLLYSMTQGKSQGPSGEEKFAAALAVFGPDGILSQK